MMDKLSVKEYEARLKGRATSEKHSSFNRNESQRLETLA